MPYASEKQRRFFHTATAKKAGVTSAMVKEYDKASKGMKSHKCSACKSGHKMKY